MAAILKLRRGTSASPALTDGEIFLNYTTGSIQYASGSSVYSLLPLDRLIDGNIVLNGNITASNLKLSGDATIDGNIVLGGSIFLGTGDASDEIIVNSSLSGSLIPDNDAEYDLGSLSKRYNNLFVVSASIEDIKLPGSGILSSSNTDFSDYTSSVENRLTNIESETSSLDLRLDDEEAKSVVLQTLTASYDDRLSQLETETGSIEDEQGVQDGRLTNLELDSASQDNRLDNLELTSQSHDDRITQLETDTGSQDNRLDNLELTSQSHDDRLGQLEVDSGSQDGRLTSLELTSASHDDRLSQIETETGSLSSRLDVEEEKSTTLTNLTASYEDRLNQLESDSGSQDGRLDNLELTSASHESRLDLLSDVSHSHSNKANLDTIDQDLATTSTVTFNTGSFTGNVIVNGNLTVLGSATEISTTELSIEDKLITLASGSTDSTTADGAGIYIDGANKSITWDHNTTSFVLDAKVTSSVGFKGDGSELTDIQHGNINFGGSNIVSGSSQVTQSLDLRYLEINGDSVVSSSEQIVYGDISSIPSNIVSSSTDSNNIDFTITNGNITANLYGGVISGSSQVTQSLDLRYLEINGDDVISGSDQVTSSLDLRYEEIASSTHTLVSSSQQVVDFLPEGTVSGSSQVTSSLDLRYEVVGNGIVSGSSQVTSSLDLRYLEINGDDVISGSSFVSNHQGVLTASINDTDTNVDLGLKESDSPTFSGLSLSSLSELGSGELNALVSGSAGSVGYRVLGTAAFLNVSNSIDNDQNVIPTNYAVNQALIDAGAGDITSINSSNLYSENITGISHNGSGTTDGSGYYGNVGDVVLTLATGSTHFLGGIKAKLDADGVLSSSAQFDDLFNIDGIVSGSDQVTSSLDLRYLEINGDSVVSGSEQIVDVLTSINAYTASNDINITNIHSTTSSFDSRIDSIESFTSSIDTTIKTKLDVEGVISGSTQLEGFVSASGGFTANETIIATGTNSVTSSNILALDTVNKYLGINQSNPEVTLHMTGEGAQTAQIRMEQYNDTSDAPDVRTRRYRGSSGSPSAVQAGDFLFRSNHEYYNGTSLLVGGAFAFDNTNNAARTQFSVAVDTDGTGADPSSNNGQFKIDGNDGGAITFNNAYKFPTSDGTNGQALVTNGSGVLSFGDLTSLLPSGVVSGSSQVNFTELSGISNNIISASSDTSNVDMIINGGSISANLSGGVVSGSTQINTLIVGTQYSESVDTRLDSLETDSHTHSNKANLDTINQNLSTTSDVTFKTGSFTGNLTVTGNLEVLGTSAEIQVSELRIEDKLITVASGSSNSAAADGGGIEIAGANASFTWDNSNSRLFINQDTFFSGSIKSSDDIVAYASSDRELKDNIQPISNPLEKINQISGNSFVWNEEKQNIYKGKDYGVIAQEIEEILPELVQTRENGYKAVKYDKIVSLLIEGIKELSKEVTSLKNRLE